MGPGRPTPAWAVPPPERGGSFTLWFSGLPGVREVTALACSDVHHVDYRHCSEPGAVVGFPGAAPGKDWSAEPWRGEGVPGEQGRDGGREL